MINIGQKLVRQAKDAERNTSNIRWTWVSYEIEFLYEQSQPLHGLTNLLRFQWNEMANIYYGKILKLKELHEQKKPTFWFQL